MAELKKGFMRTMESIIAIVLILGVLSWTTNSIPGYEIPETSRTESAQILNALGGINEFKDYLDVYDFRAIDSLIHYLLPKTVMHKAIFSRYLILSVKNNGNEADRTLWLTYHFPKGTGRGSVNIFSENETYPSKVNWVWHQVGLSISAGSQDISNQSVVISNIELHSNQTISNDSLVLYFDGRLARTENPFAHGDYSGNETDVVVNLTFLLDSIGKYQTKNAVLFYATNSTIWNSTSEGTYVELPAPIPIYHLANSGEESDRADVLFNISLDQNEKREIYMKYDINKNLGSYEDISAESADNSMVNITLEEDEFKQSTSPLFTKDPTTESHSNTKVFLSKNGLFKMTLVVWY